MKLEQTSCSRCGQAILFDKHRSGTPRKRGFLSAPICNGCALIEQQEDFHRQQMSAQAKRDAEQFSRASHTPVEEESKELSWSDEFIYRYENEDWMRGVSRSKVWEAKVAAHKESDSAHKASNPDRLFVKIFVILIVIAAPFMLNGGVLNIVFSLAIAFVAALLLSVIISISISNLPGGDATGTFERAADNLRRSYERSKASSAPPAQAGVTRVIGSQVSAAEAAPDGWSLAREVDLRPPRRSTSPLAALCWLLAAIGAGVAIWLLRR